MTAIWQFTGAGLNPLIDGQMNDVITKVLRPITGVVWSGPVQSGGFDRLCAEKLNLTCTTQVCASVQGRGSTDGRRCARLCELILGGGVPYCGSGTMSGALGVHTGWPVPGQHRA